MKNLAPALVELSEDIELLVSDNCSEDETQLVLKEFTKEFELNFTITTIRQDKNIGAVPNIFQLIENSHTSYFFFLGDDDSVRLDGLRRLVEILKESPPAHFIEGTWPWRKQGPSRELHGKDAGKWGYEMGLAWGSVYHVASCKSALAKPDLRSEIEKTIWGQIGLALSSICLAGLKVKTLAFSWGEVALERPYRYDYSNLLSSLRDLILSHKAASIYGSCTFPMKGFATLSNHGFKSHLLGLMVESSKVNAPTLANSCWSEIRLELRGAGMWLPLFLVTVIQKVCQSPLRHSVGLASKLKQYLT